MTEKIISKYINDTWAQACAWTHKRDKAEIRRLAEMEDAKPMHASMRQSFFLHMLVDELHDDEKATELKSLQDTIEFIKSHSRTRLEKAVNNVAAQTKDMCGEEEIKQEEARSNDTYAIEEGMQKEWARRVAHQTAKRMGNKMLEGA